MLKNLNDVKFNSKWFHEIFAPSIRQQLSKRNYETMALIFIENRSLKSLALALTDKNVEKSFYGINATPFAMT